MLRVSVACLASVARLACSERRAEPELQHARLIGDVRVRRWFAVVAVAFRGHIRSVVRVVEQVEHLQDAVNPCVLRQLEASLDPQVYSMNGMTNEIVARHDGAIRTQAATRCAGLPQ